MKKIKFLDPTIKSKRQLVKERFQFIEGTNIPLPSEVEISESGTCNRVCSFCPRSDPDFEDIKIFIKQELHNKLLNELAEVKFTGTLRYSGFVEPLLDKNIFNLISSARSILENSNIEMVTNGDVLNTKRLKKLFDHGLSKLFISVYDGPEDVIKFNKMGKECNLDNSQFIIRERFLPPEQDFGITMSNRAGMLKNADHSIQPLKQKLSLPCFYPAYTFFMDYQGDVLMCAHDWGKKNILGNLNKSSFMEIWKSEKANLARKKLLIADRGFSPCDVCDVRGTLIGSKHAQEWQKIYEN
tara:strand:- start:511 stop:1404 length:894 start_codon:yes stop_codon:yes gene_type:complete